MAGPAGFEPATPGFGVQCSAVGATDLNNFEILLQIKIILFLCVKYELYKIYSTF
jgi:hypothetical protein